MSRAPKAVLTAGVAVALAVAGLATTADASSKSSSTAKPHSSARHHDSTPDKSFTPANRKAALAVAKSREPAISKAFGFSKAQQLHVKDVERDADGTLHLRYTRTLGGLKVFGGDFVVHVAPSGKVRGADFASSNPLTLRAHAPTQVSATKAAHITARLVHAGDAKVSPAKRIVWAVDGIPRLAWYSRVVGHDKFGNPIPRAVVVDARTGKRIQSWDLYETAKGTGHSQYVGTVKINTVRTGKPGHIHYVLRDTSRGGNFAVDVHNKSDVNGDGSPPYRNGPIFSDKNNIWGNGKPANRQTAAVDVAYGVAKTWDYYKQTFHRNGIAGNGKGVKSRVHYGESYDNAFWSDACFCMTYGDGSGQRGGLRTVTGLDVAGHEMSHGITSRTAGLYYFGDEGGLNEANSDIFGTMVEFFAHNQQNKGEYYLGDGVVVGSPFLRRMDHPSLDGRSYNCWNQTMGLDNPHFSSGPGNHFYYLLAEGSGPKTIGGLQHNSPTCAGAPAVQGIGRAKAAAIWYRALTRYFVSTEGYIDARDDTVHAAVDLFGENSPACAQVEKAWNAVSVPEQDWTCAGTTSRGANTFGPHRGFEKNRGLWTTTQKAHITSNQAAGPGRSGKWYAWTNGVFDAASDGTLSTQITIPDSPTATLRFYMSIFIGSGLDQNGNLLTDGSGSIDLLIDGDPVGHWDEGNANDTMQQWTIPVDAYAGQTVTLEFDTHEDVGSPTITGGYFEGVFDDFSLTPR